jgi:hypothetical protein
VRCGYEHVIIASAGLGLGCRMPVLLEVAVGAM